ncbi:lithostathine-2-like [Ruditapes philippinarum]|uniref:lithostathine-2-like n=1 Tax=Ruditapes philippinarum TaxID=129788 RepID=UPI00295BE31F|nr:lithostathine-2-like [Ruditapes philippinarum]
MALLFILSATVLCINSAPLADENGINAGDLNGENLMEFGKKLKLPALQMIGKTIDNMEKEIDVQICALHPCSEWTEWSGCTARFGQFGSKFRTRRCNVNMTSCEIESNSRAEKEFEICIMDMACPNGYNLTKNGYCMKFDAVKQVTKTVAEQQCQKDGGHLLNIDSELKYKDVIGHLNGFSTAGIWIDGHRKDVNSPWKYTYGSQKGFFKWLSGQPDNNSDELCLVIVFSSGDITWRDVTCTYSFYSICEITKTL